LITKTLSTIFLIYSSVFTVSTAHDGEHRGTVNQPSPVVSVVDRDLKEDDWNAPIRFAHGDVSWLPELALKAGWSEASISKLSQIVLRESGGCPNRRGGDMVDKDCNITGVAERTHRSDSGLLQINGVNYDPTRNKWAPLCLEMDICTQKPLMDPLTNLKAGKLLFDYWERASGSGWIPWDPCNRTRTCVKP
jgi:hypothetical protein